MGMLHEQIDCSSTIFRVCVAVSITFHKFHFVMIMGFIEEILTITLKMLTSLIPTCRLWLRRVRNSCSLLPMLLVCMQTHKFSLLSALFSPTIPYWCGIEQMLIESRIKWEWKKEKTTEKWNAIYWLIFNHRYWLIELFIFRRIIFFWMLVLYPQCAQHVNLYRSISSWVSRFFFCYSLPKGFSEVLLSFAIFGMSTIHIPNH